MFNFSELKKLTKYNWVNDVSLSSPKGNKSKYTKNEYNNILTGAILSLIATVLAAIMGILTATKLFELFGSVPSGNLNITVSIDIILIIVLVYVILNKDKEHNSWLEYIAMLYYIITLVFSLFSIFGVLLAIVGGLTYTVLMTLTYVVGILGKLFMIIGFLDFSKRVRDDYNVNHKVKDFGTMESPDGTVLPYPEVAQDKTCPYCGNKVSSEAKFCRTCGANVE